MRYKAELEGAIIDELSRQGILGTLIRVTVSETGELAVIEEADKHTVREGVNRTV